MLDANRDRCEVSDETPRFFSRHDVRYDWSVLVLPLEG